MEIDYGTNNLKNVEQVENVISTVEQIDSGIDNAVEIPVIKEVAVGTVTTEQLESNQRANVDITKRVENTTEYLDFDFGIPKGETGPYFTPTVDDEGNLSWTNNGGLSNPNTVNIKGPQGPAGEGGTVDSELSETSENAVQNKVITNALNEKLGNNGEQILNGTLEVTTETFDEPSVTVDKSVTVNNSGNNTLKTTTNIAQINTNGLAIGQVEETTTSSGSDTVTKEIQYGLSGIKLNNSKIVDIDDNGVFNFSNKPTVSNESGVSEELVSESQVVRTDTYQSLTDAEKQQAQTNITHTATQDHATSGVQGGWYQVANLKTNGNYDIKIKQTYNYNPPEAIHLSISINNRLSTVEPFASITQLSGVNPGAFSLSKIRVRQGTDEGTTYLDVYNPDQLWNTTWVDITSDSQDVVVEPNSPFQFIGTEDNPSGYKVSSLDLVTGLNVNSDVTINGNLTSLSTEATPVNYIAVSKQYTIEGTSATQDINVNSKIYPSIIDLSVEGTLTNASGTTITANAVRIDPSSMRISGKPFSFSIKSSADDSYSPAASISTNGVFNFFKTPTVNSAPVFVATTPNWVEGTSGSLTLPGAGWYILYGNYSYTGIVWWSPQDPNGEQVTTGYIALNNNIAISTSGVVSLLNASSGVTVYYYKIG